MLVDNLYYYLAFTGNKWTRNLQKRKRTKLLKKFQDQMQNHQIRTLFIIAFIPKVRFFGPIIAGLGKVKYKVFLTVNTIGSVLYVGIYVTLGFLFRGAMEQLVNRLSIYQHGIFGAVVIILAVVVSLSVNKWLSR
jgi:membrane-associated protein